MENIIKNPGLQHLVEKVFWNFDSKELKICAQINQSCKQILQKPIFCLREFKDLSRKKQNEWIKVIQSVKNSEDGIAIISYLKWNFSLFLQKKTTGLASMHVDKWIILNSANFVFSCSIKKLFHELEI